MAGTTCFVRKAAPNTSIRSPWPVREPWMSFRSKACRAIRSSPTSIPPAPTCKSRGMEHSWIRPAANGITLHCAAGPGGTRTSRLMACAAGARSAERLRFRRSSGMAMAGRMWSAAMGESVMSKPRPTPSQLRPLRIIASMTSSNRANSTSTGTPCVCHSPRPWAAWAAAR